MKKYILASFMSLFAVLSFTSCSEEEGVEPGNDGQPLVTIYQYTPALPYNADNDLLLRLVPNNKVESVYYLVEDTAAYNARYAQLGEGGYNKYVVENGTEVALGYENYEVLDSLGEVVSTTPITLGGKACEVIVTDMLGLNVITVVAKGGSTLVSSKINFNGIKWKNVVAGTYYFSNPNMQFLFGAESAETLMQVNEDDATAYRFKDLYGEGFSMKFYALPDYTAEDEGGVYTFLRVPDHFTGITYGSLGDFYVRDIGYWQGSDAWVTDNGYESGMYEDGSCFFMVQLHNAAGSNYGYNYYDYFVPAE